MKGFVDIVTKRTAFSSSMISLKLRKAAYEHFNPPFIKLLVGVSYNNMSCTSASIISLQHKGCNVNVTLAVDVENPWHLSGNYPSC